MTTLVDLSPELILEIASYIVIPWHDLRSARRDPGVIDNLIEDDDNDAFAAAQADLANLRLVCRHLDAILQSESLKSITFNFHVTRWTSEADVEARLALLAQGDSPISAHAKFLFIRCLSPVQVGYFPARNYFSPEGTEYRRGGDQWPKIEFLSRAMNNYLEMAISSFQNLQCVAWKVYHVDDLNVRVMGALSSLPSLEDLTLHITADCRELSRLRINRFHDLRSLVVAFYNAIHPSVLPGPKSLDPIIDHISEIINQSPLLRNLSILQPRYYSEYDVSFRNLVKSSSLDQPLPHLESLCITFRDLILDDATLVAKLPKTLRSLHIADYARLCPPFQSRTDLVAMKAFITAHIRLQEITIADPSEPLLKYLATYSGLKKLRLLLYPFSRVEVKDMIANVQTFFQHILPLHSLSLVVHSSEPHEDGLIFEAGNPNQQSSNTWNVRLCIDAMSGYSFTFLMQCATNLLECRNKNIVLSFSPTRSSSTKAIIYKRRLQRLSTLCISLRNIRVAEEDAKQYPNAISFDGTEYVLYRRDNLPSYYSYRKIVPETNQN
ncbi:hypothetical protein BDN70DRAFT_884539 [Pholiota conissans]|uniref:Uncharacterized protein n=1 Tax=Pholiota conissans TaxID=109636 RepID=A0A9P5YT96_9AGAR|nr:hypothetical protein BDN70DRAFT_884539 [Pholiota conissans]